MCRNVGRRNTTIVIHQNSEGFKKKVLKGAQEKIQNGQYWSACHFKREKNKDKNLQTRIIVDRNSQNIKSNDAIKFKRFFLKKHFQVNIYQYFKLKSIYKPRFQKSKKLKQCCGSGMIYSRSGSSFEFTEFRIQAKVPDPCGSGPGSNLYRY